MGVVPILLFIFNKKPLIKLIDNKVRIKKKLVFVEKQVIKITTHTTLDYIIAWYYFVYTVH